MPRGKRALTEEEKQIRDKNKADEKAREALLREEKRALEKVAKKEAELEAAKKELDNIRDKNKAMKLEAIARMVQSSGISIDDLVNRLGDKTEE